MGDWPDWERTPIHKNVLPGDGLIVHITSSGVSCLAFHKTILRDPPQFVHVAT